MLDTMSVQMQYDIALQQVHNLMQSELLVPAHEIDEREIVCELVELYEKLYYPFGDSE